MDVPLVPGLPPVPVEQVVLFFSEDTNLQALAPDSKLIQLSKEVEYHIKNDVSIPVPLLAEMRAAAEGAQSLLTRISFFGKIVEYNLKTCANSLISGKLSDEYIY